jgi:hypothetical protein
MCCCCCAFCLIFSKNLTQFVRFELSFLCVRRGIQRFPSQILTVGRQTILHIVDRNNTGKQPIQLPCGTFVQYGISSCYQETDDYIVVSHNLCSNDSRCRQTVATRPTDHSGRRCRRRVDLRICEYLVLLHQEFRHWYRTRRRRLPSGSKHKEMNIK